MEKYLRRTINGKRYLIQRYVMEVYLLRELSLNEIVHHINGDRFDNRIENLKIVTRGEHNQIHRHAYSISKPGPMKWTKEEMIEALQKASELLEGRKVTYNNVGKLTGITGTAILKRFNGFRKAKSIAGVL